MATMLNGAAVMDAALLPISANETCPQPQTSEHLAAVEIMKLEHLVILQNKVDLIKEAQALEHQKSISAFVKVPISAQLKYNIGAVNEYIVKRIPIPPRDFTFDPRLIVIRSFDVNKPGAEVDELKGSVAGGSILTGVLRLGMDRDSSWDRDEGRYGPELLPADILAYCIVSLHAETNQLQFAVAEGLIGFGTKINPRTGSSELEISLFFLRRLLGVKTMDKKQTKVANLVKVELLLIDISSTSKAGSC
ncbi:hypothetical protein V8E53_000703 [Lactarius tabidus]